MHCVKIADRLVYVCDRINDRIQVFHAMAVDDNGNVYTAEVDTGKRIQKLRLTSDALH